MGKPSVIGLSRVDGVWSRREEAETPGQIWSRKCLALREVLQPLTFSTLIPQWHTPAGQQRGSKVIKQKISAVTQTQLLQPKPLIATLMLSY